MENYGLSEEMRRARQQKKKQSARIYKLKIIVDERSVGERSAFARNEQKRDPEEFFSRKRDRAGVEKKERDT